MVCFQFQEGAGSYQPKGRNHPQAISQNTLGTGILGESMSVLYESHQISYCCDF